MVEEKNPRKPINYSEVSISFSPILFYGVYMFPLDIKQTNHVNLGY